MRLLFLHQNIPGQFTHLLRALRADPENEVWAIGEEAAARRCAALHPGLKLMAYKGPAAPAAPPHPYLADVDTQVRRGQLVARAMLQLKERGFVPDRIVAHPGWGESLFAKEVYPDSPLLQYFEFFYSAHGADVGFDPEQPSSIDTECRLRVRNALHLAALEASDAGLAPTEWQRSRFPAAYRNRLSVIHDGIDTDLVRPDPDARFQWRDQRLQAGEPIVTFVARNLEPYRGFHVFMRTLPALLALRPDLRVFIVGGHAVSYGRAHASGRSWREVLLDELGETLDPARVHFTGKLPFDQYLALLQASAVHVYLTYPFVLSWSLLEAMSAGAAVVASATAPVREVIEDGRNGLLFDFFDREALAARVGELLADPARRRVLGEAARRTVIAQYDLQRICLPAGLRWIREHGGGSASRIVASS